MIIKTYESDLDGITNKLGFSKRSIAEWLTQISDSFKKGTTTANKFKNAISAVFFATNNKNDNKPYLTESGDMVTKSNIDAYLPELDDQNGGSLLKKLQERQKKVDNPANKKSWNDYFAEYQNGDKYLIKFIQNTDLQKASTEDLMEANKKARKEILEHNKVINAQGLSAQFSELAINGLASAGSMLLTLGISEIISFIISNLYELSIASEIAREKSAELTDNWVQENSSINSSISRYTELKQKLDDTSLSAAEVKSVKEELLTVQNELTDKYGQEALGIDLVNGKYDEQLAKLNELSKKKAADYVAKNYKDIQSDRDYITETVNLNKKLNFKGSQAKPDDYSNSGFDLKKYLDRYDKLDAKVVETDGQYGMSGTASLVTSGTREEVYNQLVQLFNDLTEDFGESNEDVNEFKDTLSDIIKDSFDAKQMETSQNNVRKYAEAQILSQDNTRELYTEAAAAVNNYNEALQSGEGVEAAKKNLDTVKENVRNAISDIDGAKDIFQEIYNGVDKNAETGYKISSALQTDPSLNAKAEQLKNLTTEDLMKIDFDDKTDSPGEAVLNELMENIGLSKEHLQSLIDKLAELGYVQMGLSELEDDSQPHDRFLNLWNSDEFKAAQESLLQLAKSGTITTDVLESTDSYITLLKRAGTSADDAKSRILEMLTPIQKLNAAGQNVSSLSKAMEEFQTNGYVSAATLESLPDIFKHLNGYDFNLFESIAGDSGRTKEEIQQAFNDILSCYLTDQETLKGITEENKQFYISQLEEMGIANAQTDIVNIPLHFFFTKLLYRLSQ